MLKRVLVVAAVLFMIAMLIDDPLTPLGMLIWFGDEGQGHGRRAPAANAGLPPAGSERH